MPHKKLIPSVKILLIILMVLPEGEKQATTRERETPTGSRRKLFAMHKSPFSENIAVPHRTPKVMINNAHMQRQ